MVDKGDSKMWDYDFESVKSRIAMAKMVRLAGGNKFQELEARLTDAETGKLVEDIVIYALRIIKDASEARDFIRGYVYDVKTNPEKYSSLARMDALDYVRSDIHLALDLHFRNVLTHKMWDQAFRDYE